MKRRLFHNEDCTEFFYRNRVRDGKAEQMLNCWVDTMAKAGVTDYIINTNARRVNYRSDAWEAFWDGYDSEGSDDQPFLKPIPAGSIARYRDCVDSMLSVHAQGIDYPAYVIERCRREGMTPWISLRMNDCHCYDNMEHPFHGSFWKNNQDLRVKNISGWFSGALNYAHDVVRDYFIALIDETLDRYDVAGLELDFMREPYIFDRGKTDAGAGILDKWLREVRQLVESTAARRGHPIRLGVRLPSCPETTAKLGFNVTGWVGERLIDVLVFTPRYNTLEFDMPVKQWREIVSPETGIVLAGGLEAHYMPRPDWKYDKPEKVSPELARGAAALILSEGADAVYLFNYFQNPVGHPGWDSGEYQKTLQAMSSLDELLKLPRSVGVTFRDITAPDENYRAPLPANGAELEFTIKTGPVPDKSCSSRLRIGLDAADSIPAVTINNHTCLDGKLDEMLSGERIKFMVFELPHGVLDGEARNVIKISSQTGEKITVMQVEIDLFP